MLSECEVYKAVYVNFNLTDRQSSRIPDKGGNTPDACKGRDE